MANDNITSTTDTKVFVGGESSAKTKADFEALTWAEIGSVNDIGTFGDTREEVTADVFGAARRIKRAGIRDAGKLTLKVLRNSFDAGQEVARDGFEEGKPHAFKIELDDRPAGTTGKATVIYVLGVILSKQIEIGGPNGMVYQIFELSLTDAPLEITATA